MKKTKIAVLILSIFIFVFVDSNVFANSDATVCVYDYITFTITPDGAGNATLSETKNNKPNYEMKKNYVTVNNFVKNSQISCPNTLYYKTESGGYGAANSNITFLTIGFNINEIPVSERGSIGLTSAINNNNVIGKDYEYMCSYVGKINGTSIIIKKSSDKWNITYPNGTVKTIAGNLVGNNSLPSSNCEDLFYSESKDVIKMVEENTPYTNIYVARYCSEYEDLEQFCENGICKITDSPCGNNGNNSNKYGECPKELRPIILFLKRVVMDTLKIFVPILLIIMGTIDLVKAVVAGDDKSSKDAVSKFIKRVLAAVLMFFITTIVSIVMNMIASTSVGPKEDWKSCWIDLE